LPKLVEELEILNTIFWKFLEHKNKNKNIIIYVNIRDKKLFGVIF